MEVLRLGRTACTSACRIDPFTAGFLPMPSYRRIQLCKRQPGSGTEQQCTAVLLASPLLPPGLAVPYTLGTAGVAAEVHAAAAGHAQPMQL